MVGKHEKRHVKINYGLVFCMYKHMDVTSGPKKKKEKQEQ